MSHHLFWLFGYLKKRFWPTTLKENEIECPIDFEWKFAKSDLIALKDSVNRYLQGRCFYPLNIPGLQCHLIIYPNGNGQTYLFLFLNASKERKITAEFKFIIESANFYQSAKKVFEKYDGCGTNICKTGAFFDRKNKYFVDEEITIKVKGILKAQRPLIPPSISTISRPISFQWKIKEDDLKEAVNRKTRDILMSPLFNTTGSFLDLRYYFFIYPAEFNAHKKKTQTSVSLNVSLGYQKKTKAVFDFSIDSACFRCNFDHVFARNKGYGDFVCSTEDFFDPSKRFIVDGYLTINFNGVLLIEKRLRITMKCKNGLPQIHDPKDFSIVIGDKEIQVHKQLLMDASPVFAGMIGSGMKDKMMMKNFPFKIVAAAIKLFYNQNGICSLRIDEMFLLHKFAAKYLIEFLLDHVERALIKMISSSNVCKLIQLSTPDSANVSKLHESCIKFLDKCYKKCTRVYGAESLGEKFLASLFLRNLHPASDTLMVKKIPRITIKCKNGISQKQDPKDFIIVIDDKEIQVHKQLLMEVSPVFARMVESGMKESIENKMVIIDFSFKIVDAAIKLFYNQNGFCSLSAKEMFTLHKFAGKYFIEFLLDHVELALIKMISPFNVCQLIQLSAPESFSVPRLHESCIVFLDKCYKKSTPVFGVENLEEKFLASMFLRGLRRVSNLFTFV